MGSTYSSAASLWAGSNADQAGEAPLINVAVQRLDQQAVLPKRATDGSAGYDLCALHDVRIEAGEQAMADTGLAMAIPPYLYGQIAGRSGLALRHRVEAHRGVVDSDYRGRVQVMLSNHGSSAVVLERGSRIAQILFLPVALPLITEQDSLDETARGEGGFGSTGVEGPRRVASGDGEELE